MTGFRFGRRRRRASPNPSLPLVEHPPIRIECAGGCGSFVETRNPRLPQWLAEWSTVGCGRCEGWLALYRQEVPAGQVMETAPDPPRPFTAFRIRAATPKELASRARWDQRLEREAAREAARAVQGYGWRQEQEVRRRAEACDYFVRKTTGRRHRFTVYAMRGQRPNRHREVLRTCEADDLPRMLEWLNEEKKRLDDEWNAEVARKHAAFGPYPHSVAAEVPREKWPKMVGWRRHVVARSSLKAFREFAFLISDAAATGTWMGFGSRDRYLREVLETTPEFADWAQQMARLIGEVEPDEEAAGGVSIDRGIEATTPAAKVAQEEWLDLISCRRSVGDGEVLLACRNITFFVADAASTDDWLGLGSREAYLRALGLDPRVADLAIEGHRRFGKAADEDAREDADDDEDAGDDEDEDEDV
jgi:hypothetical protein